MIQVEDLVVRYGSAVALDRVSLNVQAGEMVALVGSNGSGKSTLLNALSRVAQPASGSIRIRGRFAHVPEGRQLFPDLSVDDNLRLGAFRARVRGPRRREVAAGTAARGVTPVTLAIRRPEMTHLYNAARRLPKHGLKRRACSRRIPPWRRPVNDVASTDARGRSRP